MEATQYSSKPHILHNSSNMNAIVQVLAVLFSLSTLSSTEACNKTLISSSGFSFNLIHRDSALSPFYNSSLTPSELIIKAALRSISRMKHFQDDAGAVIIPNRGDYLMKIFLGTPPVEFHAAADTGSDLVWLPCLPCGLCDPQDAFDPADSSTFMVLSCDSQPCSSLPKQTCGNSNQCRYF